LLRLQQKLPRKTADAAGAERAEKVANEADKVAGAVERVVKNADDDKASTAVLL
jgi:hypothetical protein